MTASRRYFDGGQTGGRSRAKYKRKPTDKINPSCCRRSIMRSMIPDAHVCKTCSRCNTGRILSSPHFGNFKSPVCMLVLFLILLHSPLCLMFASGEAQERCPSLRSSRQKSGDGIAVECLSGTAAKPYSDSC